MQVLQSLPRLLREEQHFSSLIKLQYELCGEEQGEHCEIKDS